jgi:hypothetical protein
MRKRYNRIWIAIKEGKNEYAIPYDADPYVSKENWNKQIARCKKDAEKKFDKGLWRDYVVIIKGKNIDTIVPDGYIKRKFI